MSILLTKDGIAEVAKAGGATVWLPRTYLEPYLKAQAKKILVKLQAIYNLPDGGMFNKKMGEFIQKLMEEVK